tara:strand:- start:1374 stop:2117 length:744 start_codon:yes stop_codon:yes gene_type:complete
MFDNIIKFIAHEDYVSLKEDYPTPIKLNIPKWYKKLEHSVTNRTIKGCIPVLDSLTSGYLLKVPQDYAFVHNTKDITGKPDIEWHPTELDGDLMYKKSINLSGGRPSIHPVGQVLGSPMVEKNKNLPFLKIMNPWLIKTPPGYSCLFLPPMNNTDDRFSIIPAIVDTDTLTQEINFPIVINGDKYPTLDTTIKKGTPYVQVIPFKREPWKMKIESASTKTLQRGKMFQGLNSIHIYKNKFWNKKKWS